MDKDGTTAISSAASAALPRSARPHLQPPREAAVRRRHVLHEQQLSAPPKHAARLGERAFLADNRAQDLA
jgi:hypothetical protein